MIITDARNSLFGHRSEDSLSGFPLVAMAAALWGTDALFRKPLAEDISSGTVVFAEHAILVAVTFPFVVRNRVWLRSLTKMDWVALLFIGAGASAAATVLFTAAFARGDPTTPLLLQKLQPFIAVVGARILLGERLRVRFSIYLVGGMVGAYLLTFPRPSEVSIKHAGPALLAVAAAVLWALGTVLGRRLTAKVEFTQLTALRFAVGLPASAIIVYIQGGFGELVGVDAAGWRALILLAMVPGLFALLIYYRGLRSTPAAAGTLAELAFPLTAISINYVAFGAVLSPTQVVGVLLLSGTIATMGIVGRNSARAVGIELRDYYRVPREASA